jgi:endonuclease I
LEFTLKHARPIWASFLALAFVASGCGVHPAATANRLPASALAAARAKAAPANYYAGAEGQSGQALLRALNQIVSRHKDLGYDGAREAMFKDIDDVSNNNVVTDIYLGRVMENVTGKNSAYQNGNGMNAEHTWPQSKGAEGVAKSDLHHLFPADVKANSTRGSFPFGDVVAASWQGGGSQLGTNTQGQMVFTPRPQQRGNTARAIFYFYMMYGLNGGIDTGNFRIEESVLKRWHKEDPVDATEATRNDKVMTVQGNRNPFVDHPEWVDAVGNFMASGNKLGR